MMDEAASWGRRADFYRRKAKSWPLTARISYFLAAVGYSFALWREHLVSVLFAAILILVVKLRARGVHVGSRKKVAGHNDVDEMTPCELRPYFR